MLRSKFSLGMSCSIALALAAFICVGCSGSREGVNVVEAVSGEKQELLEDHDGPNPDLAFDLEGGDAVGNEESGYVVAPEGWEDRTLADYGREISDMQSLTYIVDPDSKLDSVAGNGMPMYKTFIMVSKSDNDYEASVDNVEYSFAGDANAEIERDTSFSGQRATIVHFINGVDNADVVRILIDSDNVDGYIELIGQFDDQTEAPVFECLKSWKV